MRYFLILLIGFLIFDCQKKNLNPKEKSQTKTIIGKWGSFLPYSVDFLFDNNYHIPLEIPNFVLDIQKSNFNGNHQIQCTRKLLDNGDLDMSTSLSFNTDFVNGIGTIPCPISLENTESSENIIPIYLNIDNNEEYTIFFKKQFEFGPLINNTPGFVANDTSIQRRLLLSTGTSLMSFYFNKEIPNTQIDPTSQYEIIISIQTSLENYYYPPIPISGNTLSQNTLTVPVDLWGFKNYQQINLVGYVYNIGDPTPDKNKTIAMKKLIIDIL